ncbi:MAG: hypothetical protein FJX63_07815, partial [Alphaproteobacteria bacterium]|nr:hypothetical protein [Alphaproteobacteria bacterium]
MIRATSPRSPGRPCSDTGSAWRSSPMAGPVMARSSRSSTGCAAFTCTGRSASPCISIRRTGGSMPRSARTETQAMFARVSALADVAIQGRFGADKGAPGVALSLRHPVSIVTVIARKGKAKALATALAAVKGANVQWAGADQYYVVADGRGEGALYREMKDALDGLASVIDQSHGRFIIRIAGPNSRAVLAKGTPVDL